MISLHSFKIPYQKDPDLLSEVCKQLDLKKEEITEVRVIKKSLDARNKRQLYLVYSLNIYLKGEKPEEELTPFPQLLWKGPPPLIIGAGPAGLFAAHTFLAHGIKPILFERGERTYPRMKKISLFWRQGILDPDTNVCNGEGGAGTFSDGKLITRIKSPHIARVLKTFVDYGAPPEIRSIYNPHVGSNLIRNVIQKMSDDLISRGAHMNFQARVTRLILENKHVSGVELEDGIKKEGCGLILACGHSAGDFFNQLHAQGVFIEAKSFALGLRIEHLQSDINRWQYGRNVMEELGAAQYKLSHYWDDEKIGVYSFCMCPGGYVISSTTDSETTVVNGMSNYHRNSPWANAAIVTSIDEKTIPGNHPFKVMKFQREIEQKTFEISKKQGQPHHRIPAQRLEDFLLGKQGVLNNRSSCPSGVVPANLKEILPNSIYDYLCKGLLEFEKKRKGFLKPEALLHAVESRTSSPIRITRHEETLESISTPGLFPCGEGPGYAGGITSAAVDGIKAALAWIKKFSPS